jgi:hypothetical protein
MRTTGQEFTSRWIASASAGTGGRRVSRSVRNGKTSSPASSFRLRFSFRQRREQKFFCFFFQKKKNLLLSHKKKQKDFLISGAA